MSESQRYAAIGVQKAKGEQKANSLRSARARDLIDVQHLGEPDTKMPDGRNWRVQGIPIASIDIGQQQLRRNPDDDDIIELAADIATNGLMQPIGVSATGDRYQLRWGSRRLAAHVRLRRHVIIARIIDPADVIDIVSTAARENLLRRNLTLREEIDAITRLAAEGRNAGQIADLVSKSREWVNRRLAFDQLPLEIRDHVLEGTLPLGHAEVLALVTEPGAQSYLTTWCLQNRPSLAALRAAAESFEATPSFSEAVAAGQAAATQQQTTPTVRLDCHVCLTPTLLAELQIVRCCPACAHALARAGGAAPEHNNA